jgi:hypothetical protein
MVCRTPCGPEYGKKTFWGTSKVYSATPTIFHCLLIGVCSLIWDRRIEVEVNLRPTASRPVCLGVRRPSGNRDQFFFLLEVFFRHLRVCYFRAPSLTRGLVCNLLYNCFWALPEQSLLGRSPAELRPYFTVSFETPATWRVRSPYLYPPGTGWPSYTSGHCVPFQSPLTTRRAAVEVF